jgi:hypothetical protein
VRAGGPPSTNALILAFVLPLSLFVGTLVTAARVADDLDERFLREVSNGHRSMAISSFVSKVFHGELGLVHNGHQTMSSYLVE